MSCSEVLTFCITQLDICNEKILASEIAKVEKQLSTGIGYYEPYRNGAESYLKQKKLNEYVTKFLTKLCSYLNLSEKITHTIFVQFLASDGHLEESQLKALLNSGHATLGVMHRIRNFYYEERLSLLRLYKMAWHENWSLAADVIFVATGKKMREDLINMLIKDYNTLTDLKQPNWSERVAICDEEEEIVAYLEQCLNEQMELLEGLMMGFYSIDTSPQHFHNMIALFESHSFGRESKLLGPLVQHSHTKLMEKIGLLQSLIIIRLACLDEVETDKKSHFLSQGNYLRELNSAVVGLGERAVDGPLLLLSVVCQIVFQDHTTKSARGNLHKMTQLTVCQLNVFSYLSARLAEPPLASGSSPAGLNLLSVVAHSVAYDLVCLLTREVQLESIPQKERGALLDLLCKAVEVVVPHNRTKSISGLNVMMESLATDFPRDLSLLRLCRALMSDPAGEDLAVMASGFLDALPSYADRIDSLTGQAVVPRTGDGLQDKELRQVRFPYGRGAGRLCLPRGTRGTSRGGTVIVWELVYSAWDVVRGEIGHLLDDLHSSRVIREPNRIHELLTFIEACLKANQHVDDCITVTLQSWSLLERGLVQPATFSWSSLQLLSAILRLTGQALSRCPNRQLVDKVSARSGIIPHVTATTIESSAMETDECAVNVNLVGQVLDCLERPGGRFPATQAYLELLLGVVQSQRYLGTETDPPPPGALVGGLIFAAHDVLATCQGWRFADSGELVDIAENCLLVFNEVLTQHPGSAEWSERVELVQDLTVRLLTQSTPALQALLALSAVSVETLQKENNMANDMLSLTGCAGRLSRLVWLALALLNHLLAREPAQARLVPMMEGSVRGGVHYIGTLMSYLNYPYNVKMTRMAISLLKRIVQLSSMPVVSCLGESSASVRDVFLRRLASSTEDQVLRASLFDLLSECLLCGQPGLLQLMLAEPGCLECAEALLTEAKVEDEVSVMLLWSVSKFYAGLWLQDCHSVVRQVKESPKFWEYFSNPLLDIFKSWKLEQTQRSVIEIELLGNTFSVLSMEIYSNGWENCSVELRKSVETLHKAGCHKLWCQMMLKSLKEADVSPSLLPALYMCMGRWKSLLVVLMARTNASGNSGPGPWLDQSEEEEVAKLMLRSLDSLDLCSAAEDSIDMGSQLASTLSILIHRRPPKQIKLLNELTKEISCLLVKLRLLVPSACNHAHVDLMATATLLLARMRGLKKEVDFNVWKELFDTTIHYTQQLSLKPKLAPIEEKVLIHSVTLIATLIDHRDPSEWLTSLSQADIVANLLAALGASMMLESALSLSHATISLLAQISSTREGAVYLSGHAVVDSLALPTTQNLLQWTQADGERTSEGKASKRKSKRSSQPSIPTGPVRTVTWSDLVTLTLRLVSNLLVQLGWAFFPSAAGFFSGQWSQLSALGVRWRTSLCPIHVAVAEAITWLVWSLADWRSAWTLELPTGVREGMSVLLTSNVHTATGLMQRPSFVQHRLMLRERGTTSVSGTVALPETSPSIGISPTKKVAWTTPGETSLLHLECRLMGLVGASLAVFARCTPLLGEFAFQPMSSLTELTPMVELNFSDPNLDEPASALTYGVLVAVVALTGSMVNKLDSRTASRLGGQEDIACHKQEVVTCQEVALTILMSQALLLLNNPAVDPREKQYLIRELSPGMTSFVSSRGRLLRRSTSGPGASPARSQTSLSSSVASDDDHSFYRAVERFVRSVLH